MTVSTKEKEVAVVVVFTGYTDGTVDFSQDATRKDFATVELCFRNMARHFGQIFRDRLKCPFNPDNPDRFRTLEPGGNRHHGGDDA